MWSSAHQIARFVMGTVAAACAIELGRALFGAIASGQLSHRLQGGNGPDTEGLLAAVLIVTVLYGRVPRWPWARAALIGLGVLSLILTRSVGSIAAVGLVLAFAPPPRRAAHSQRSGLLRPLQLVVVLTVVIAVVVGVRSSNVPGQQGFSSGSTMNRIILGAGGVEVFAHHPVFGVGFARSFTADGARRSEHHLPTSSMVPHIELRICSPTYSMFGPAPLDQCRAE